MAVVNCRFTSLFCCKSLPSRLFVGDSEVDAETAHAAGVPLLLYAHGYRKAPLETLGAAAVFDDFAQLPGLVAALS